MRLGILIVSQEEILLSPRAHVNRSAQMSHSFVATLQGDTVGSVQGHAGPWALEP